MAGHGTGAVAAEMAEQALRLIDALDPAQSRSPADPSRMTTSAGFGSTRRPITVASISAG